MERLKDLLANAWLWFLGVVLAVGVVYATVAGTYMLYLDCELRCAVLGFTGFFTTIAITRWSVNRVDPPDDPYFSVVDTTESVESRPDPPPPSQPAR